MTAWKRDGDHLTRSLEFPTFMQAIDFINQVARAAEEMDHHPDILISYRRVTLNLSSHDVGGVTSRDLALDAKIDLLITQSGARVTS